MRLNLNAFSRPPRSRIIVASEPRLEALSPDVVPLDSEDWSEGLQERAELDFIRRQTQSRNRVYLERD